MNDAAEARAALDEAVRIAPTHQGALLELERVVAKAGDTAGAARRVGAARRGGRAPGAQDRLLARGRPRRGPAPSTDIERAQEAFAKAAELAGQACARPSASRASGCASLEEIGTPADVSAAIDALATVVLAAFGPAGPGSETGNATSPERSDRATALRHELVALRRRQAQLVRAEAPEKAWELLQQASALAPGESIVLSDLTELAEELGRYDDLAELVQSWQAVEARSVARRWRCRSGAPMRCCAVASATKRARCSPRSRRPHRASSSSTSAAERDALGRGDAAELAKVYLGAANASLLGTWLGPGQPAQPDPAAAAALYIQAAELLAYEVGAPDAYDEAKRRARQGARGGARSSRRARGADRARRHVRSTSTTRSRRLRAAAARDRRRKRPILERAIRLARGHGDLEAVLALERELVAARARRAAAQVAARVDARASSARTTSAPSCSCGSPATRPSRTARAPRCSPPRGCASAPVRSRPRPSCIARCSRCGPGDTFARESLVDLLRAQERWPELVTERRAEAKALPDGPAARRALREAAWVLEVRLDDAAQAAAGLRRVARPRPRRSRRATKARRGRRAKLGDRNGEVAARARARRARRRDAERALPARPRARARRRSIDEAADVYRALIARDGADVGRRRPAAALALGDLAAGRADTVMRVESTAALAGKTGDPRLGAALAEDSGWMYALVLEDFDRAAQSFEAAIALDADAPRRAARCRARRRAPRRAGRARRRRTRASPRRSRCPRPRPRCCCAPPRWPPRTAISSSRTSASPPRALAAPDDASALLVVAETARDRPRSTPATRSPRSIRCSRAPRCSRCAARSPTIRRRARRGSSIARRRSSSRAGCAKRASSSPAVLKTEPGRSARARGAAPDGRARGRQGHARPGQLRARARARRSGREARAVARGRDVFDGPGLPEQGLRGRRVQADRRSSTRARPSSIACSSCCANAPTSATLIHALTERLVWLEGEGGDERHDRMAPLLLERATVLHGLGDQAAAMGDLDVLLDGVPRSRRGAAVPRRPRAQRGRRRDHRRGCGGATCRSRSAPPSAARSSSSSRRSSTRTSGDVAGAIEQLERVVEANPEDPHLRERLLGLCLRVNDWERAIRELRQLTRLRPTRRRRRRARSSGSPSCSATRSTIASRRGSSLDRARAPRSAQPRCRARARRSARAAGARADAARRGDQPPQRDRAEPAQRPCSTSGSRRSTRGRSTSTRAGSRSSRSRRSRRRRSISARCSQQGRQQARRRPSRVKLDELSRAALRGSLGGPLAELWRAIAPAVQVATGVDIVKLGFARGDKLATQEARRQVRAARRRARVVRASTTSTSTSARPQRRSRARSRARRRSCASAPTSRPRRCRSTGSQLGRAVASIAEGVATLAELHGSELEWTLVAALRAADVAGAARARRASRRSRTPRSPSARRC